MADSVQETDHYFCHFILWCYWLRNHTPRL